ncbi:MAG: HD domain-containing phosphohydrolase, partial [Candidatus Eremiobacterota bacterium]
MSTENLSLLILEDDAQVAASLERALKAHGYQVQVAQNAAQAVEIARRVPLDLILCDVRMPGVDGLEALATLRTLQEGVRSIVMTGYASEDAPVRAIQNQVDDYLFKPVPLDRLLASIRRSTELCQLEKRSRRAMEELRLRYLRLVSSVVSLFWDQDRWFCEHSRRVAALAVDLGTELGLLPSQLDQLELAALLHDLGLAFLERELLHQERPLTPEERARLEQHPQRLSELLDELPDLRELQPILLHLHERWDGTGYPQGLSGQNIPLSARILAVAEAWDSLLHARPHRPALAFSEAVQELEGQSGRQFDPSVVSICLALAQEHRELVDPRRILSRPDDPARGRWRTLLRLGGMLSRAGQPDAARQALLEAGEMYRQLSGEENLEVLVELAYLESQHRPEEALRWLARARPLADSAPPALLERMVCSWLQLQRAPMARELLERALNAARAARDPGSLLSLLGLRLSLLGPDEAPFQETWKEWLDLFRQRLDRLAPEQARDLLAPLQAAVQRNLEGAAEVSARLVEQHPYLGERLAARVETTPSGSLQVLCFGPPEVRIAGRLLPAGEWASRT